jgi:signal transduction histidine kinase
MDAPLSSLAETSPLTATLLADTLLEQTWIATAPETWFAAPFIVVLAYAFALSKAHGRTESEAISRLTAAVCSLRGNAVATATALRELRALSGARDVMVAVEGSGCPAMRFGGTQDDSPAPGVAPHMLTSSERPKYFFSSTLDDSRSDLIAFGTPSALVPVQFRAAHPFDRLAGFACRTTDWEARVFLIDPPVDPGCESPFPAFQRSVRQLLPALGRLCDLHGRRHRAEERERARLGRELHDGTVQELTCLDMELELIGISAQPHAPIRDRISRVQDRLRAELRNLRTLVEHARSHDVDSTRLPVVLEAMVQRFGRDTRVRADYVSRISDVRLPPQVCGEITRIVQEALMNVRRHSGARHVVVTFSCDNADWKLSIQDDGRGFDAGRPGRAGVARGAILPPSIIDDRVHSLGATVRVVDPGPSGARIEISARQRDLWNRRV